jgi:hypothetical protein
MQTSSGWHTAWTLRRAGLRAVPSFRLVPTRPSSEPGEDYGGQVLRSVVNRATSAPSSCLSTAGCVIHRGGPGLVVPFQEHSAVTLLDRRGSIT